MYMFSVRYTYSASKSFLPNSCITSSYKLFSGRIAGQQRHLRDKRLQVCTEPAMGADGGSLLEKGLQVTLQRYHPPLMILSLALSMATTMLLSITASVYSTVATQPDSLRSVWAQHYSHPAAYLYSFLCWLRHMSPSNSANYAQTASLNAQLVINNMLHIVFVLLYLQAHFKAADIITHCAFTNMCILYLRLYGPLAWAFISFYWTGPCVCIPSKQSIRDKESTRIPRCNTSAMG
ncbi:hypothetical protein X797_011228 [Metarhizium robertsii]|uniref:Uncharacterized protein n=1 Tax=Metarhizium robertsii TaxID=568076 RepID=A0A0A1UML0_9HYPO|nr:hypothetical protein X797_011228 [Metarhizium robertsii]